MSWPQKSNISGFATFGTPAKGAVLWRLRRTSMAGQQSWRLDTNSSATRVAHSCAASFQGCRPAWAKQASPTADCSDMPAMCNSELSVAVVVNQAWGK
mmetsp:Transcript_104688/g.192013  ORF Transcript_104688/g.192013 Transcript_104688/m.192013 type:complete len:98 (-) Transcript_104688:32-325(-)